MYLFMNRVRIALSWLYTQLFYRPFSIKMGKDVTICNPICLTSGYLNFGNRIFIRDFARIEGVKVYQGQFFSPQIKIFDSVTIEQNLPLTCADEISIGEHSSIGANVTITDIYHLHDDIQLKLSQQAIKTSKVYIGDNCNIFNNSVILPGTILGKSCVVGANTVVRGGIYPDYSLLVGVPAKVVKRYSTEHGMWVKTDEQGNFIR